jgi:hypothetical protein
LRATIKNIRAINEKEYQLLWDTNSGVVFQNSFWLNMVISSKQTVEYFGYYSQDILVDAFAIVKLKGKFFTNYTLPIFTPFLGWIKQSVDPDFIVEFLSKKKADAIYYATKQEAEGWRLGTSFIIDLQESLDQLQKNMRQDKKRSIKKADQSLSVRFEKNFETMRRLVERTYQRQGKQFNGYNELQKIIEIYPNTFQITVCDEKTDLASLLFVYDKTTAYYLIGGFDHDANNYNAGPYAMWKGIEYSKQLNLKIFDFEGSEIPSIAQYFQSFGGVQKHYFSKSKYGFIFSLLKKYK